MDDQHHEARIMPPLSASTEAAPRLSGRLDALTAVRAFAAIWVVLFHYRGDLANLIPMTTFTFPVIGKGYYAVDLFFVLSGFILAYTYFGRQWRKASDYWQFLGHRVARIYPVHLVTILALVVLLVPVLLRHEPVSPSRYTGRGFLEGILLIQGWGFKDWETWNQPSWSLSAEWFAYLFVFPLAYFTIRTLSKAGPALLLTSLPLALYSAWTFTPLTQSLFSALARVSCEFFSGCALFVFYREKKLSPLTSERLFFIGMICLLLGCIIGGIYVTPLFLGCMAMIILGLSSTPSRPSRFLSWRPMVYAGEASFSLYMTHGIVQKVIKLLLPSERFASASLLLRILILIVYLVMLVTAAIAAYEFVEKPMRRRLRGAFDGRKRELTSRSKAFSSPPTSYV